MTLPATTVASAVQSMARPAPRTRIARQSAPAGLTQSASASRTRSTYPEALRLATEKRLEGDIDVDSPTYFLSRITISVTHAPVMHRGRKRLFVAVARNAAGPVDFRLPHERPITMGWQVRL
jgi:K+ transporter